MSAILDLPMTISIIIPCYNEADNIPKLQRELLPVLDDLARHTRLEAIFVDDGSADQTWEALLATFSSPTDSRMTFLFKKHEVNRGLGAALRTGFRAASGEWIVTTDSDGTYRFETIPELLQVLASGMDLVTASPYHPKGEVAGVPAYRLVLSQGASFLYRLLVRWDIHTYTCLYRAYRRWVTEEISFEADDFLAGSELMVKALFQGARVAEYPAVLNSRVHGVSKARILRTILSHLRFQFRILLYRFGLVKWTAAAAASE